jgi:hypothetical protein
MSSSIIAEVYLHTAGTVSATEYNVVTVQSVKDQISVHLVLTMCEALYKRDHNTSPQSQRK